MNNALNLSYKLFNPNFYHLITSLQNDSLRYIYLYGGSSSAKSFSCSQAFLLECLSGGNNTLVFKKVGASIKDSIYKSFVEASKSLHIDVLFKFKINRIECFNGSYIVFKGLDESEKIKGLDSFKYVLCEECSDLDFSDFKQIRKRLRGRPGQKIITTFNPISSEHWIKTQVFDKEILTEVDNHLYCKLRDLNTGAILDKAYTTVSRKQVNKGKSVLNEKTGEYETMPPDTVIIKSTYLNNFWVVGSPDGVYGYVDRHVINDFEKDKVNDPAYYNIYALGEWGSIRTGGEFLHAFNSGRHVGKYPVSIDRPIHVSIDNNVLPYISITFWQVKDNEIRQVHEIPARDPFNTVTSAGDLARKYLQGIGYRDVVYLYGDASTRSGNTIDDEKRSFLDKFIEKMEESYIVEDRIPRSNPSVSMTGEFINHILSDRSEIKIRVNETCRESIYDYENTKKDVNGAILKTRIKDKITGQTYEKLGHLLDTFRYFLVTSFADEYTSFSNRRLRNDYKEGNILYFNSDAEIKYRKKLVFVVPECNDTSITIVTGIGESYIDILDVVYSDKFNIEQVIEKMDGINLCFIELSRSYIPFLKELREKEIEVLAMKSPGNIIERIEANEQYIKENVRFSSSYTNIPAYEKFMNTVYDYNQKDSYEGLNILSFISLNIRKRYF